MAIQLHTKISLSFIKPSLDDNAYNYDIFHHRIVIITSRALYGETRSELQATIGHELGHCRSNKFSVSKWIIFALYTFLLLAVLYFHMETLITFLGLCILLVINSILINILNRQCEFIADSIGAKLTSNKDMINSLLFDTTLNDLTEEPHFIDRFTYNHPPLKDRIVALSSIDTFNKIVQEYKE